MFFVLLLTASTLALAQSPTRTQCSPSPTAEEALAALPAMSDLTLTWEQRIAPRRTLAEHQPDNWPLQIELQDAIRRQFHIGREWDRALDRYRRMSDRVLGELLEARLILPFHRRRSKEMIDRVLKAAPDAPWAHLVAAEWAANPLGRDANFGATHLEEFRRLCPQNPRAFAMLDLVQEPEKMFHHVQDLRALLDAKKRNGLKEADLQLFRAIWTWEKAPANARSDLAAIRALKLYRSTDWYTMLRVGYEQTLKDPAPLEEVRAEILQQEPKGHLAWWIEEERSRKSQQPDPSAYQAAMRERFDRFGAQPFNGAALHQLLFMRAGTLSDAEVERYSDLVLQLSERYPDQGASWPPVPMLIAEVYAKHKLRLDRVPVLVQQALEDIEFMEKHRRDSDAIAKQLGMVDNTMTQRRAREVLLRHAIASGQTEKAKIMLADLRRRLEQTKPANDSTQSAMAWRHEHLIYLELAKLAGVNATPVAELLPPNPERGERFPVADFEAKDLSGKTWRLADLKGKVAYVNVWTTWCTPCRAEMPGIAKLHERWKDRKDRVVLTISADLNESLARDFIRENKYTFPVIHGSATAEKFFPPVMFPQNWIIDPQGRRLETHAPPTYDATLPQIEQLADRVAAVKE